MTREEFVNRWKYHVTGMALCGHVNDTNGGPLKRASDAFELPSKVVDMLGKMFDDATQKELPVKLSEHPAIAGAASPVNVRR